MRFSRPFACALAALVLLALVPMAGCVRRAAPPTATNGTIRCWRIVQFNPKPDRFPKCVDDPISRDDFVIVTDPSGHEPEVEVSFPDGTSFAGTHPAYARRKCPSGDVQTVTTTYEVLDAGHDFVMVQPLPGPTQQPGTTVTSVIKATIFDPVTRRVTATYSHDVAWSQLGQAILPAGSSFTTTVSEKWNLSGEAGIDTPEILFLRKVKLKFTVKGGWESSTSHTLTSPGGAAPYTWRITHYQGVAQTVRKLHFEVQSDDGSWSEDHENSDTTSNSSNGTSVYGVTYEKKCP